MLTTGSAADWSRPVLAAAGGEPPRDKKMVRRLQIGAVWVLQYSQPGWQNGNPGPDISPKEGSYETDISSGIDRRRHGRCGVHFSSGPRAGSRGCYPSQRKTQPRVCGHRISRLI